MRGAKQRVHPAIGDDIGIVCVVSGVRRCPTRQPLPLRSDATADDDELYRRRFRPAGHGRRHVAIAAVGMQLES